MKVLHVAECIGGVDRYLRCLLKYSTCENIMILSQLYNSEDYKKLADSVEIMQMTHGVNFNIIKEVVQLRGKIKKNMPDIVYAHSSFAGAIVRMACIGLKVKVIYNPHGWSFNMESDKRKIFIILERIMAHFCDAIICISDAEKESALREKICRKDKLYVVYNGIDIEEYDIEREEVNLPIPKNSFVVGMVGRICKQKAPDIFVKMAAEVQKKISNAYFLIVGDVIEGGTEERKEIEDLATQLGVKLFITGWVDNPLSYMDKFNVGCLLSRWEGFGLAIPEYMLTKTPIVATKVDAIPYLIEDGENGLLVEKDDWKTAAEKVIYLYENREFTARLLINEGKIVKNRFDARRVSKECEKIYQGVLKC